jgi:SAM-dependent methyltransferase
VYRDHLRRNFLRFSERAWSLLPPMTDPRILDIGCGTGLPTLRLAELSGGSVVGLDRDPEALTILQNRAADRGLSHRVTMERGSLAEIPFEDASFDVVWCEGALDVLGFRESLRAWRRLLKPGGCMVFHDQAGDVEGKLRLAREDGCFVLGSFEVPETVWWDEYFALAEEDPELAGEIQRFRADPSQFRSAFFAFLLENP